MKFGTFLGVDFDNRTIKGANQVQMTLDDYMRVQGIRDHRCILGPFESRLKGAWSDKELHEKALEEARKKQKALATKLKKERNSL